ncbi:hypothetical protein [Bradyrhizobium yuanmingense]|uniref:hypothetical protein n=1 Tax=Bradyrhizobium yuanmingense TaxID=108015 RepID=UPI0023B94CD1|nr:hypothetical protein [Bradyrhizobium yuanmingense]MDF0584128.1 hypothetical protein [Bradyrhizobium yuanmingense]
MVLVQEGLVTKDEALGRVAVAWASSDAGAARRKTLRGPERGEDRDTDQDE